VERVSESELFRAELQQRNIGHVQIEINLAATFLHLSHVEFSNREAWANSFIQARLAIIGARRGLSRVTGAEERELLDGKIVGIETAIREFNFSE